MRTSEASAARAEESGVAACVVVQRADMIESICRVLLLYFEREDSTRGRRS